MTDFANAVIQWGTAPSEITLLELMKQQLGITDAARDEELSLYLDMSGNACESYIDNIIQQRDVKEYLTHSFKTLALRYWPAGPISSVLMDGTEVGADYETFTEDGLTWSIRQTSYGSTCDYRQMIVTYSAGYNPIPSALGYAIVTGAAAYDAQLVTGGPLKKEVINGVGSLEYDTASSMSASVGMLPSNVIGVLDDYRRYHV